MLSREENNPLRKAGWNRGLSGRAGRGLNEGALLGLSPSPAPTKVNCLEFLKGSSPLIPSQRSTQKNASVKLSGKLRRPEQRNGEEVSA